VHASVTFSAAPLAVRSRAISWPAPSSCWPQVNRWRSCRRCRCLTRQAAALRLWLWSGCFRRRTTPASAAECSLSAGSGKNGCADATAAMRAPRPSDCRRSGSCYGRRSPGRVPGALSVVTASGDGARRPAWMWLAAASHAACAATFASIECGAPRIKGRPSSGLATESGSDIPAIVPLCRLTRAYRYADDSPAALRCGSLE
jgi:hypothetical protein